MNLLKPNTAYKPESQRFYCKLQTENYLLKWIEPIKERPAVR